MDKNSFGKKVLLILPIVAILLVAVLMFIRAFYGFDWSDESYNLALPYRFLLGDRPFVNSWDADQISAILMVPVLWLYRCVTGSMDGILLFTRILFVLVQTAVALAVYNVIFKLYENRIVALFTSLICLSFVPYSMPNFSYYTISSLLMIVTAVFFLFLYTTENPTKLSALAISAGVAYAFACLAQLCCIAVLPFFLLLLAAVKPYEKQQESSSKTMRPLLFFLCGYLTVLLLVCGFLLITVGIDGISKNISVLFYNPDDKPIPLANKISFFIREYYNLVALALLQIFMLAILFLCRYIKTDVTVNAIFTFLVRIFMPFCIVYNIIVILIQPEKALPLPSKINQIQICAGLWPLVLFVNKPARKNAVLMLTLYIPANILCVAFYLSSSNGITGACCALTLAVMSACPMIYEYYKPWIQTLKKKSGKKYLAPLLQSALAILAAFVIGSNVVLRTQTVFHDSPLAKLTAQIQVGPAKGLYTTPSSAANYAGIVADIRASVPKDSKVLFSGLLPFGYLCIDQTAATPTFWRTQLTGSKLASYFADNPADRPTFVYIVKKQYGSQNSGNGPNTAAVQKIMGQKVTLKETKYAYQYTISE